MSTEQRNALEVFIFVVQLFGSKTAPQCMLVCRASGVPRYFDCDNKHRASHLRFCLQVGAVVSRIGEKYREAALALVSKAYSTIRIADLALYLGQVTIIACLSFLNHPLTRILRLKQRRERRWQLWAGLKNQEW